MIWNISDGFIGDRSFFTREGGLVGFGGGGPCEKNGFRGGAIPKKLGKKGGPREIF